MCHEDGANNVQPNSVHGSVSWYRYCVWRYTGVSVAIHRCIGRDTLVYRSGPTCVCTCGAQWSAVERSGAQWSAVERSGAQWSAVERSGAQWSAVERSGAQWSAVERSGAQWSAVERSGSGVELQTLDYENPGSNLGCGVKTLGKFFHSTLLQFTQLNK